MSRFHSYLNSAKQILSLYNGAEPFSLFIKEFFRQHKKFGSADRKLVSQVCYCFFRTGKAFMNLPVEEKILAGLFLCSDQQNELLHALKPEWNKHAGISIEEKLSLVDGQATLSNVFPFIDELSSGIEPQAFVLSHFNQSELFLRLRPGFEKTVIDKLLQAEIPFHQMNETCLTLANSTQLEGLIEIDREAVIQDYSSQQTVQLLKSAVPDSKTGFAVWDCCAASGGKSILIHDLFPAITLTVSDIRESILINLGKRLKKAGIRKFKSFRADLTRDSPLKVQECDLIVCDAPCTGSGTWGRTPEQLYYFDQSKIYHYATLQKSITQHIIPALKPGGYLLYITCSVFRRENEDIVAFLEQNPDLKLVKKKIFPGYKMKADTMFAALMMRNAAQ